ncbi:FMN-dependent NADH-azoreductase [Allomesorhizobium camelthorni]|uniref:FMN dependent NADH:quinone oxidoreductase n=1 Tax=Allomesorhizobium camelthorni TaxID=475069 RepID=A0A6G4WJI8_9HYPH|nr:FMN-dependent NADH-azoreductase [Mesorhizobium camelthorni]NGO54247.1 FMN-dependent NADH-azoreductase [Mesorhizobium camelthorni]
MASILLLTSSPRPRSLSTQIAVELAERLCTPAPAGKLVHRDLAANPLPHMEGGFATGIHKSAEALNAAESAAIGLSNELVAELLAADTLVIGTAFINFNITSNLKSWIDHIGRAGKTFRYTATGPEGLAKGKKAYIVLASGGVYSEGPAAALDHATPYLKAVLGFIGITDVEVIRIEGVNRGPDGAANAVTAARTQIARIAA